MRVLPVLFCVAAVALAGDDAKKDPSRIGHRDVSRGVNIYSLEREIALGKQLAQEIARQAKMVDDPIVAEYINRLGRNLARNSDAKAPFEFKVIDSPDLNAFALPGGFIFVNAGLMVVAESEAELAGAMAHEVAHVAARHMTRQASQREILRWATLPLILAGGWTGYAARQGAGVGIPMTFLSFGRKYEAEADMLGLQYAYAAGYDPTAAIDLFEKMRSLERKKPGTIARVFSTHPMNADRIRNVQKQIEQTLPARPQYVVNTSEYRAVRARMLALIERQRKAPGSGGGELPTLKRRELVD